MLQRRCTPGGDYSMTQLNPYINFKDDARQAMEFYHSVFGGNLSMNTFEEFHATDTDDPKELNKIMHAQLETDNGILFMGSDTPAGMEYSPASRINMSLSGEDEAELRGYWEKLMEGGTQIMPLEKAPWGDTFGMLTDKFGITWLVNINGLQA